MTEIKNINEWEPRYWADGSLHWMPPKKQKKLNRIRMDQIDLPKEYVIDSDVLEQSRAMYEQTHRMIPVYINRFNLLIGGFEQYLLAQELGKKEIPFMRKNKVKDKEQRKFLHTVHNRPVANKKYRLIAEDGSHIYVTAGTYKKYQAIRQWARKNRYIVEVTPTQKLRVKSNGEYIYGKNQGIVIAGLYKIIMKTKKGKSSK